MKRILGFFLSFLMVFSFVLGYAPEVRAYVPGQAYQKDLSTWIKNPEKREYVQMMLDHYVRTDTMVQQALEGGFTATFLFDGCSDNMDDPALQDLTYYRVTGICVVLKVDARGQIRMIYFNDNCSTIPDKPLEYGAWALPEVGDVGPATICDGTYQLYSVYHKGKYEALHVRTEYWDPLVDAVYMTPEGYVKSRASEINVHTRTSNHISGSNSMWSAGCPLVGDGDNWEFWKLVYATYDTTYGETFEVDNFLGTLTVDRQAMREELGTLYRTKDAVDRILTNSRNAQPEKYLLSCSDKDSYKRPVSKLVVKDTTLMTLPCSNATDARSLPVKTVKAETVLEVKGSLRNAVGNKWFEVEADGQRCYVYSGHMEKDSWVDWLFDTLFR